MMSGSERRLCRRNPIPGGRQGGVRRRRATTVGRGAKPPSQGYKLRDLLPVIRGVAERELRRLRALEVQVQIVLPREADAAVELDAGARDLSIRVRRVGLG